MEIASLHCQIKASELPIEKLAGNTRLSEAEKLAEVSRQFEAILLRQVLSQAQKTLFHSKIIPDSAANGVYQDLITGQLADNISQSGTFGLGACLEQQLRQEFKTNPPAEAIAGEQKPALARERSGRLSKERYD